MKYMGGKSALLKGGLGDLVLETAADGSRFVDLFSGSGSVSHFVAEQVSVPVASVDLQLYSTFLAGSITKRTAPASATTLETWLDRSRALSRIATSGRPTGPVLTRADVEGARFEAMASSDFITRHYGGHYYSLEQASALDELVKSLPEERELRDIAMAAVLHAASACAASPGHTAQPFQPTPKLLPHIANAWRRDVFAEVARWVQHLAPRFAHVEGETVVGGAADYASHIGTGDVVFCDPPYSAAQYSRFYHVLEGIARGGWVEVGGAGRSPAAADRAVSDFSLKGRAHSAMASLLDSLARAHKVILTFPDGPMSNGLSGKAIAEMASCKWNVAVELVDASHSTLGGSQLDGGRGGRRLVREAVITLTPRAAAHAVRARSAGQVEPLSPLPETPALKTA